MDDQLEDVFPDAPAVSGRATKSLGVDSEIPRDASPRNPNGMEALRLKNLFVREDPHWLYGDGRSVIQVTEHPPWLNGCFAKRTGVDAEISGDVSPSGTTESKRPSLDDLVFGQDVALRPIPDSIPVVVALGAYRKVLDPNAMSRVARSMTDCFARS